MSVSKPLVVSQRSWHYRLLMASSPLSSTALPPPKTLCGYFWAVVLSPFGIFWGYVFKWTVVAAVSRIVRLGDIAAAIILSAITASFLTAWAFVDWRSLAYVLGGFAIGLTILVATVFITEFVVKRLRKKDRPDSTSSAHLVWATVKAKKRRVCPLIEVRP